MSEVICTCGKPTGGAWPSNWWFLMSIHGTMERPEQVRQHLPGLTPLQLDVTEERRLMPSMPPCSVDDCAKPAKTRGMCGMHAERVRKFGDPSNHGRFIVGDPVARFWSKVEKRGPGECWPWRGTVLSTGYGQYELEVGPIPEGLTMDHVWAWGCTRRDCVNPAHLEPVTEAENRRRSAAWSAVNERKDTCPRGHPYDLIRTRADGRTYRACRRCRDRSRS